MTRAKKGKIQSEAPRYNLKQLHKLQSTKINSLPENKNKYKRLSNVKTLKSTPPLTIRDKIQLISSKFANKNPLQNNAHKTQIQS